MKIKKTTKITKMKPNERFVYSLIHKEESWMYKWLLIFSSKSDVYGFINFSVGIINAKNRKTIKSKNLF